MLCIAAACTVLLLCGCTRSYIDDSAADEITERGRVILEDYVKSLGLDDYSIGRTNMMTGAEEGNIIWAGYYLSNVVKCDFTSGGKTYTAAVNLEDGEIYTDYGMFDLNAAIAGQLRPYCEKYGYTGDVEVSGATLFRRIISHDMETTKKNGERINTEVNLEDTIPAGYVFLSEDERIEKVLNGAHIEGFTIYYDIQNGQYLDPGVLTDYLAESGNHEKSGSGRFDTWDYYLSGSNKTACESGELPQYWNQTISYDDNPEKMSFSLSHRKTETIGDFFFLYTDRYKSGETGSFYDIPFAEYEFPIEINGNVISYYDNDSGFNVSMYFREKPKYTQFTRTVYDKGIAQKPEELVLEEKDSGTWSLNRKENPFRKDLWYFFDREQDISFK